MHTLEHKKQNVEAGSSPCLLYLESPQLYHNHLDDFDLLIPANHVIFMVTCSGIMKLQMCKITLLLSAVRFVKVTT